MIRPSSEAARPLPRPRSETTPELDALIECLRFSPGEGRIWFDNQPVALIRTSALSSLHHELVDILGQREAGYFLAQLGFASGSRDAQLARKLDAGDDLPSQIEIGHRLRAIRGIVSMRPVRQEADLAAGHFYAEAVFSGDFEADTRLANDGISHSPVCWMQVGFASGFASTLLGRPVIYKEVECRASGSRHCRIMGKLLEEWHADEIEAELHCIPKDILEGHRPAPARPRRSPPPRPSQPAGEEIGPGLVGTSPALISTWRRIQKVAETSATVLLLGETGVGKGVFAYALHQTSRRRDKPFIAMNCAAIPENLIEAELFGVEKGAFTGATQSRPGRFERADGGTLFLDEVGCLSLPAQLKLLRAIQEKEIERVGDTMSRRVDVRIVAATNEKLEVATAQGRFREDLLFRLNVFPVHITPLRERREDIPPLLDHFLARYNRRHGRHVAGFSDAALTAFCRYDYPGNIRELENLVERAVILGEDHQPIDIMHLVGVEGLISALIGPAPEEEAPPEAPGSACATLLDEMLARGLPLKEVERRLIMLALRRADGNISQAARLLGMTRPQFAYRLDKLQSEE